MPALLAAPALAQSVSRHFPQPGAQVVTVTGRPLDRRQPRVLHDVLGLARIAREPPRDLLEELPMLEQVRERGMRRHAALRARSARQYTNVRAETDRAGRRGIDGHAGRKSRDRCTVTRMS